MMFRALWYGPPVIRAALPMTRDVPRDAAPQSRMRPRGPAVLRVLAGGLALTLAAPSLAQDEPAAVPDIDAVPFNQSEAAVTEAGTTLGTVEGEIALSQERIAEIRAEIAALSDDSAALTAQLVAAGARVDATSEDVHLLEDRLQELFASEEAIRARLDGQDQTISTLLSALQRISANPPPAIIVDPRDALGSARAAMLLSALLPQLRAEAETVTADLEALAEVKAEADAEARVLRANLAALHEERLRIATVIEARRAGVDWLSEELILEEAQAQALADRAASLERLISGLETRLEAVSAADAASRAAAQGQPLPALDPETIAIAFADADRTEPALPLGAARGYLSAPVAGGITARTFGASDGFGGTARGLSVVTAPGAPVHTPADGWVAYAGDFLNYGQILVLNAGQDYTILLAGLDAVSVEEGQFLRMGEVVGTMGTDAFAQSLATGSGADEPTLYIELREGGEPINPAGWWVAQPISQEGGSS